MAVLGMTGCTQTTLELPSMNIDAMPTSSIRPQISIDKSVTVPDVMYAAVQEGPYSLPAVPYQKVPVQFRRQIVVDPTGEQPGTIVVRLQERFLYLVQAGGDAIRYGVGIGKDGFLWSGRANIQYKKEWPRWTPPREMIQRKPELAKYQNGMEPGPQNPLGASTTPPAQQRT